MVQNINILELGWWERRLVGKRAGYNIFQSFWKGQSNQPADVDGGRIEWLPKSVVSIPA